MKIQRQTERSRHFDQLCWLSNMTQINEAQICSSEHRVLFHVSNTAGIFHRRVFASRPSPCRDLHPYIENRSLQCKQRNLDSADQSQYSLNCYMNSCSVLRLEMSITCSRAKTVALFTASEQTQCALVVHDSDCSFTQRVFQYPIK